MKTRFQAIAAATMIAGALALTPAARSADEAGASLRVDNSHLNMGRVVAGATASATFVFHNDGENDIHILRATPS